MILRSRRRALNTFKPRRKRSTLRVEFMEDRVLLAVNPIVAENQLPGTPASVWSVSGAGDSSIQGFSTDISVNHGQTISFKINDQAKAAYHIDIYRLGYYQGNGARLVTTIPASQTLDQVQPAPLTDPSTGLVDAGNWAVSASWAVPASATSGLYIARLTRNDTGGASLIYFVVRADDLHSAILFQTSDESWEAYNTWGGSSLYQYGSLPSGGGAAVSYNRPLTIDGTPGGYGTYTSPMHSEYPMIRFLEQNGYDVSYFTDVDAARNGNLILNHQVYMDVGHDEYWSAEQRNNVTAARDAGVNLAFFAGDEIYWKTRWLSSIDGSNTNYRTVVCYKETVNGPIDPSGIWTGTWRDARYSPPQDGGQPENALSGTMYMYDRSNIDLGVSMTVPYADANLRFWRNTAVANLQSGQSATLGQYVVGYEIDQDVSNAFRPAGMFDMSSTTFSTQTHVLVPWAQIEGAGTGTNSTTLYRAASGALVFSAGSVQWAWGLDGNHNDTPTTPDPSMQQATINLLADMKVQPGTLMAGMVAATASTDVTAPTSRITSPLAGAAFTDGIPVTITGTASDSGGGVVAGVEVSTDGGQTWQPATGRGTWSFTWIPSAPGNVIIETRAVDDSANLETPSDAETVKVSYTTTSTTGLVASYNFNQGSGTTLTDQSGKGNNGTISNATWSTQGHTGGALSFNGTNSIVSIPSSSSLNLTTGMTLEAWVDPTNVTSASPVIFKEGSSSPYSLYSSAADGFGEMVPNANATISGGMVPQSYTVRPVTPNTWTFVAATFDGTSLTLYVNGQPVCSTTATSNTLLTSTGTLDIGGDTLYKEYFSGLIDDVRVYNRALNVAEIQADMSTPVGGTLDTVPPTGALTAPANQATVSGTIPVTATASDNVGIAGVQFLINGTPLGNEDFTAPYTVAWNTANYANGSYVLSARVRDMAGNVVTTSSETVTVKNGSSALPTVVSTAPAAGASGVSTSTAVSATFNEPVQQSTIAFTLTGPSGTVPATLSYNAYSYTATITPSAYLAPGTTYTASMSGATDANGKVMTPTTWTFTTAGSPSLTTLWPLSTTPAVTSANDTNSVELGVKFTSDTAGYITGIDFYKGNLNIGTHVAHLWTSTGTLLASATFTNETPTGWQQVSFASPVAIAANTTYIASYFAPKGGYAVNSASFNTQYDNAPLHVPSSSSSGGNGVYAYSSTSAFPTSSYNASNYWITPVFTSVTGSVVSTSPTSGATGVATTAAVSATFNEPVQQSTITFTLTGPSGAVPATFSYNAATNTATITPNASLATSTTYTASISGTDGNGIVMSKVTWSFTTAATSVTPTVVSTSPTAGATGVATSAAVSATFNEAVQQSTIVFTLTGPSGAVPATLSYNSTTYTATITPNAPLTASTTYTASISGATDSGGKVMSKTTWTFSTAASVSLATLWPLSTTPTNASESDRSAVELGVKFTSDTAGYITGIDFYKGTNNTGTHVAHLWTSTGTLLASATFTNETGTGWQQVTFSTPVAIAANTTYVASYFAPKGGYADDTKYFNSSYNNAPLHAPSSSSSGGNGVYVYGSSGGFPTSTFNASNYWVTPVFTSVTPTVVSTSPAAGATGVATSAAVSATFNEPVQQSTISFTLTGPSGTVPATLGYNTTTNTAAITPNVPLAASTTYTASISGATDANGVVMTRVSWTFTTTASSITPTVVSTSPAAGATGVANTAAVSATFNEAVLQSTIVFALTGPSGAVPATLSYNATTNNATITPNAPLTASTTYTASISGATDSGGKVMSPLSWTFTTTAVIPTVQSTSPSSGATGVSTSTAVSATFNEAVQQSTISFTLTGPAGAVPATLSYNATTNTATITPNASLFNSTTYTASISGATDSAGSIMTPLIWSFTTVASVSTTTLWPSTATPTVASVSDGSPIEVGVKFTSDTAGNITGIRFYKGTTNSGTHVAHLWTSTGTLLASATFTSESASGWQEVDFSSPVAIAANTTYVASYYSPNGYFAIDSGYFASTGQNNAPLHAPSSPSIGGNGVYTYATGGGFPSSSANASNYWVDVAFSTTVSNPAAPTVLSTSPVAGATSVSASAGVSATFNEPVQQSTIVFTLTGPSGAVPATLSYNAATNTATLTPNAPLALGTLYTASISGATDSGGKVMSPVTWTFTTAASIKSLTASLPADFSGGAFSGTVVSSPTTGGIQLASNLRDDFNGSSLSSAWTATAWSSSAANTLSGGILSVAANEIIARSLVASDTGVEGSISFTNAYQHFGMATDLSAYAGNYWAIFSTMGTTNTLFARVNTNGTTQDVSLGALPTGFHTYKILPVSGGFAFYVDGTLATTINATLPAGVTLNPILSDFNGTPNVLLQADWVRVVGGSYVSSVFDAGQSATWLNASWTANLPTGTSVIVQTSTSADGVNWSSWAAVTNGGTVASPVGRYFKYRILLISPDSISTPVLSSVSFTYS